MLYSSWALNSRAQDLATIEDISIGSIFNTAGTVIRTITVLLSTV